MTRNMKFVLATLILCWTGLPLAFASGALERLPLVAPDAHQLNAGASTRLSLDIPADENQSGEWRGIVSLDLYGALGNGKAKITLEAVDATNQVVLCVATGTAQVEQTPPLLEWAPIFSSEIGPAAHAFRGGNNTQWIATNAKKGEEWVGAQFKTPTRMTGLQYQPRTWRQGRGLARKYRVDIRKPGGDWETMVSGERTENPRSLLEVPFPEEVEVEAFRFVVETDWHDSNNRSAQQIFVPGVELAAIPHQIVPPARAWVDIPPEIMAQYQGQTIVLRVQNVSDHAVAIGQPRCDRVHIAPDQNLFARPRRGGPDRLSAGLLGFRALATQNLPVLPIVNVYPLADTEEHPLRSGDAILAIQGRPLPRNSIRAGWEWFNNSHEAMLGRETEAALQAGKTNLVVTVLRKGLPVNIPIPLNRQAAFTTLNPADDPEAARMLEDAIGFLVRTQRDNGSWNNRVFPTLFAALSLLATGEEEHIERARQAVEWTQRRYPEIGSYRPHEFWPASYANLLYIEWLLTTEDESVRPRVEEMLDWAVNRGVLFSSRWEMPSLGHGPAGLPYSQRGVTAPGAHVLVVEALAKQAGIEGGFWKATLPFMERSWSNPADGGHGALGYNPGQRDNSQHWSRSGMFALAAHIQGEREDMRDAMIQSMINRYPWFRNSHAYGEPGGALGLLALNYVVPDTFAEIIQKYAWWFSLAWEPGYGMRFTEPHQGATSMGGELIMNAAYALVLQAPLRTLAFTGREP